MKHHGRDAHWVEASDSAAEQLREQGYVIGAYRATVRGDGGTLTWVLMVQKEAVEEAADCTLPYPEWRLRYSGKPEPFRLPERHDPDTLSFREDGQ